MASCTPFYSGIGFLHIKVSEPEPLAQAFFVVSRSRNKRKVGAGARINESQLEVELAKILQAQTQKYIFQLKTCLEMDFWANLYLKI